MTFLIAEGVIPSNEGRGYVLRRLIRRAVVQARRIGLEGVYRLPAIVVGQVGPWYPEVVEHADADRGGRQGRGGALPGDARARACAVFDELAGRDAISGEQRLHARRHLRLPARAHGRAGRGARPARRRRRLPRADGRAPHDLSRGRRVRHAARGRLRACRRPDHVRRLPQDRRPDRAPRARGSRRRHVPREAA